MPKRSRQREKTRFSYQKKVLARALQRKKRYKRKDYIDLLEIEDRRLQFERYPKKIDGTAARIDEHPSRKSRSRGVVDYKIAFDDPKRVVICKRRSVRRHALFAIKKIGKGKQGPKKKRLNEYSKVRC